MSQTVEQFVDYWKQHGDEQQETQDFWNELIALLGADIPAHTTKHEQRTAGKGRIDLLFTDARLLVEQKSASVDLDKPEERQKEKVTPVQQALRYSQQVQPSLRPNMLCTCNFHTFRFYDLEVAPLADQGPQHEFTLDELPENMKYLRRLFSSQNSRIAHEEQVSETASIMVAKLHGELAKQYKNPDSPVEHHALSMLTVRLVFCLYAEDAGLFPMDLFSRYVKGTDAPHLRRDLVELFEVLNTPISQRDPYLEDTLSMFPYVNGGLFAEHVDMPPMNERVYTHLIAAGENFDWKHISPVIFGSLMEETLSHDQRRADGMHYTTVENIHRVIDPLFLDSLEQELVEIETHPYEREHARVERLKKYQDRLASLQFLDPACGSGNFLTETFLKLRELENRAITCMLHGQGYLEFGSEQQGGLVKVKIDQMHGIEINDFAVCVAKTALWIAEQQALDDTESIAGQSLEHLPLHDSGNVVCANALRYDWNSLLPGDKCDYVMGNPPFVGQKMKNAEQREDLKEVWGEKYDSYLDYVTGWYLKAARYLKQNDHASFAFVSTNGIARSHPASVLFKELFDMGWRIHFAHKTFAWSAQSTDVANVHVVIVGMDKSDDRTRKPFIFEYETVDSEP